MNASFAAVDSRVRKLAPGYVGGLATGDRMLQVSDRRASARGRATRGPHRWVERAFDWVNYDEVALARSAALRFESVHQMVGPELPRFWRKYTGGLHLRANVSRHSTRLLSVVGRQSLITERRAGQHHDHPGPDDHDRSSR
jgi:hypothetical protein